MDLGVFLLFLFYFFFLNSALSQACGCCSPVPRLLCLILGKMWMGKGQRMLQGRVSAWSEQCKLLPQCCAGLGDARGSEMRLQAHLQLWGNWEGEVKV